MQDPADIEVRNAFMKQSRNRIVTTKGRDDYLNEITFRLSGKKLPADATPMQRAEAMNQVLNDKKTKLRFIFSIWPRQPNPDAEPGHPPYRDMTPKNSFLGKMTPNGNQFWAATLFDFYFVQRFHDQPELRSISTASKLVQWAKANGETDGPTKVSIQWAEDEKDPELIPPYDIRLLIEHWEEIRRRVIASQIELEGKLKLDEWALPEEVTELTIARAPLMMNCSGLPSQSFHQRHTRKDGQQQLPTSRMVSNPYQSYSTISLNIDCPRGSWYMIHQTCYSAGSIVNHKTRKKSLTTN